MPGPDLTPLLSARGLTAVLPGDGADVRVLDGIDLDVHAGEISDIVGPSGAGKTTLVRALARLLPGTQGALSLRGESAEDVDAQHWRCAVALLPQKPAIFPGSIRDNLLVPWTLKAREHDSRPNDSKMAAGLDSIALGAIALDRDASRLSVGQQARIALLRVVLASPSVLLLDEPDAALDEESALTVRTLTRRFAEQGGGVVRVRHREDDGLADRRLRLSAGRLTEVGR